MAQVYQEGLIEGLAPFVRPCWSSVPHGAPTFLVELTALKPFEDWKFCFARSWVNEHLMRQGTCEDGGTADVTGKGFSKQET